MGLVSAVLALSVHAHLKQHTLYYIVVTVADSFILAVSYTRFNFHSVSLSGSLLLGLVLSPSQGLEN